MKKIVFIIVVLALLAVGYSLTKNLNTSKNPIESIKENLPSSINQTKSMGGELPFPLTVNGNFNIKLFTKLNSAPRVLAFDSNGVLVVSIPSEGKVFALLDKNGDGVADESVELIANLTHPHGIEFNGGFIYVAEEDKLTRFSYNPSTFKATDKKVLFNIPDRGRHTTRTVKIYKDKIYLSVGSSCDVCVETTNRADVWVSNLDGSGVKVFAKGLRNTVFFTFDSKGQIWGADMGRDFLGDGLPREEINLIQENGDYGWPYCYDNKIRDTKFSGNSDLNYCETTIGPKFEMPAHIAPLGIIFNSDGDVLLSQHGSWNSSVPVGYKVVKINKNGDALSNMQDFITGFISGGKVLGRPVDLLFDKDGNLFISDDKADNIYIVSPK